jgi:hypothetical protein
MNRRRFFRALSCLPFGLGALAAGKAAAVQSPTFSDTGQLDQAVEIVAEYVRKRAAESHGLFSITLYSKRRDVMLLVGPALRGGLNEPPHHHAYSDPGAYELTDMSCRLSEEQIRQVTRRAISEAAHRP